MSLGSLRLGSLVLYKNHAALVRRMGEKLEVELPGGESRKVRPKDIVLLHPGPLASLAVLKPLSGDFESAWEILQGSQVSLKELAELVFGSFTPLTAWSAWQAVSDGLYFSGNPEAITPQSGEEIRREKASRQARLAEQFAWSTFILRARSGILLPEDSRYIREVEDLAYGRHPGSRILRELGHTESPESAHAWLIATGWWDQTIDPYPHRFGLAAAAPDFPLPDLVSEPRTDLTQLLAYAIDDEESQEPDDAISAENLPGGLRWWVHIADVSAFVSPESAMDIEARSRGATLYLPEGAAPMLPPAIVPRLGLGMQEISPALSFALDLDDAGELRNVEILLSLVRVERLSYPQVEMRLEEVAFRDLRDLAARYQARRTRAGAVHIELPEVKVIVDEAQVRLRPLPPLTSRFIVREAMLAAGEGAARFALQHQIPFPYAIQDPSEPVLVPPGMARMWALRRAAKRGQVSSLPGLHAGLGLEVYTRATSPLRRYLDLVVHQQLRAYLHQEPLLDGESILERVGASEAVIGNINQAEARARQHWTLVYLMQHPGWQGKGVLVDKHGNRGRVLLPDIALESNIHLRHDRLLNSELDLEFIGVDLPFLESKFRQI